MLTARVTGLLLVVQVGGVALAQPAPQASSASALLEMYRGGAYDEAVAAVAKVSDFPALAEELKVIGPAWTVASAPASVPRRQAALAAFALESARTRVAVGESGRPSPSRQWPAARELVEWACGNLRAAKSIPDETVRSWLLASVSLAASAHDWVFLSQIPQTLKQTEFGARLVREYGSTTQHLRHARERFPEEPRLRLVEVLAQEHDTWRLLPGRGGDRIEGPLNDALIPRDYEHSLQSLVTGELDRGRPRRTASESPAAADIARLKTLEQAARGYSTLTSDPVVGPEARLRLAYIHLRFGRWQESLDQMDRIDPQIGDDFVAYLRAYFRGWLLERLRRPVEAVASYKAALALVPNGPSAVERLAILLFSLNRRSEAFALAGDPTKPRTTMPYDTRRFYDGDARFWVADIRRLRDALK